MRSSVVFTLALFFGSSLLVAQDAPHNVAPRSDSPATVHPLVLDVQVTDKSGAPISGLSQQDFTLLDGKQPQRILGFHAFDAAQQTPPIEVVLVVDTINTKFHDVSFLRDELKSYLLRDGGKLRYPTSLIIVTEQGTKFDNEAVTDANALYAQFEQFQTGLRAVNRHNSAYGAEELLDLGVKNLSQLITFEAKKPSRKLMIWISPGWPYVAGPDTRLSGKDERLFFQNIVALSSSMRDAHVTLYDVDPAGISGTSRSSLDYYKVFLKPAARSSEAQPGDLGLQVLAVQSGGRVLNAGTGLADEIASCAADATSYYAIIVDMPKADKPNEYHPLTVAVNKPGAVVRTRTGFYTQP